MTVRERKRSEPNDDLVKSRIQFSNYGMSGRDLPIARDRTKLPVGEVRGCSLVESKDHRGQDSLQPAAAAGHDRPTVIPCEAGELEGLGIQPFDRLERCAQGDASGDPPSGVIAANTDLPWMASLMWARQMMASYFVSSEAYTIVPGSVSPSPTWMAPRRTCSRPRIPMTSASEVREEIGHRGSPGMRSHECSDGGTCPKVTPALRRSQQMPRMRESRFILVALECRCPVRTAFPGDWPGACPPIAECCRVKARRRSKASFSVGKSLTGCRRATGVLRVRRGTPRHGRTARSSSG